MATVNGTTSQNSSKYDFYFVYTTSFDSTKMLWTVTVTSYLKVIKYKYSGTTSHNLTIGGVSVDKDSSYSKTCGDNSTTKVYKIASGKKTYAASKSARKVTLKATMSAPSGGYGPGTCSSSKTITLPAKLSSAGSLSVSGINAHGCTLNLTDLATGLGYARTCKFYYKKSTITSWSLAGTVSVASGKSSGALVLTNLLLPNTLYDFKCSIAAPDDTVMCTLTGSTTTSSDLFTLSVASIGNTTVSVKVSGLVSTASMTRTLKGYYRVKGTSAWLTGPALSYAATTAIGTPQLSFTGLTDGVTYEFIVYVYYGTFLSSSASTSATTVLIIREDYTIGTIVIDDSKITVPITDNKSQLSSGLALVYVKGSDFPYYYAGEQSVDFSSNTSVTLSIDISDNEDIKGLSGDCSLKIVFCSTAYKIMEILQLTVTK